MQSFNWNLPTEIRFGSGKLAEAGAVCRHFGTRCLVVSTATTPWLHALLERVQGILSTAGVAMTHFDGIRANPTTEQITAGAALARRFRAEMVLGLGGGSSMDAAKAIAAGCEIFVAGLVDPEAEKQRHAKRSDELTK